jgi:hypothetical protein
MPVKCGNGHDVGEDFDPPTGARRPCPECGSTVRAYGDVGTVTVRVRVWGRDKFFRAGYKRPAAWGVTAMPSLFRKTGRLHLTDRSFDRIRDWYHERIVDAETGELVHECDEPLSQHRGHGDARRSTPQRPDPSD